MWRVWSGAFFVTQNIEPAGSPEHVPATTSGVQADRTEADQSSDLGSQVVGAVVEVGAHRAVGLAEPFEQQMEGGAGVVMPLAGELVAGELTQRPRSSAFQNSTSASCLSRGESMQNCTILDR